MAFAHKVTIMIATIAENGILVFDLNIQDPWEWIDLLSKVFPNSYYIGCYGQYENCLVPTGKA